MELQKIKDTFEMQGLLEEFSNVFTPPLYINIENFSLHAEKLIKYSENYILRQNDKNIGFICFYANDFEAKKAFISLICVKEEFQKKGYASALLEKCFELCKDRMNFVELEVFSNNTKAISFYKKHGFVRIEKESKNPETFFMRKSLEK